MTINHPRAGPHCPCEDCCPDDPTAERGDLLRELCRIDRRLADLQDRRTRLVRYLTSPSHLTEADRASGVPV
jgi:hypothetical protein